MLMDQQIEKEVMGQAIVINPYYYVELVCCYRLQPGRRMSSSGRLPYLLIIHIHIDSPSFPASPSLSLTPALWELGKSYRRLCLRLPFQKSPSSGYCPTGRFKCTYMLEENIHVSSLHISFYLIMMVISRGRKIISVFQIRRQVQLSEGSCQRTYSL